jgi:AGZA family xanthine/uracil permease-like MFS transporter
VAACFLLALPLHPIISIIPAVATAPALMMVGVLMMQSITSLNLRDLSIAVPAIVTIVIMVPEPTSLELASLRTASHL